MYISKYSEYKKNKAKNLRDVLRHFAIETLIVKNKLFGKNNNSKNYIQFLYFHHVFDDEVGKLRLFVADLQKNYTFISFSKAVELIITNKIDKQYIVFSSDDGLKNNMNTLKIFNDYNIQSCFFINPGIVGETNFNKIKKHCKQKLNSPPLEFLSWNDIDTLLKHGHEIGSHTMFHDNLISKSRNEIIEDIEKSHMVIMEKCGVADHFAFPYGTFNDYNKDTAKIIYNAKFKTISSAVRGVHLNSKSQMKLQDLCIRRDHVIFSWKQSHLSYFLYENKKRATFDNNLHPYLNK